MEYSLTDLCELIMGQSPDSSSCNKDGKGIPFYQGNADFGEKNPTPRNWCLQPKKIAQKDDILISVRAPIGDLNIANEDCCIGRGVAAIRMKSKECDRDYLYLFLESKSKYLQDCGTGSTFTAINKGVLESLKVKCPELKNQTSIANEIENIKAAIKYKNSELICLNEAVQSEFVEMFGDPIFNSKNFPTKKVKDVVTMQRGYDLPVQNRDCTGKIPVFGSNGILGNHNLAKMDKGIITGRSGTIGEVYMCETPFWPLNTTLFSNDTHGNNICYLKFLLEFFDLKRFKSGVGVPTLNRNEFHDEQIIDVPLELQNQFAAFVEQIDKSKFVLHQQLQFIKKYDIMTSWRKICFYTTVAM